MYHSVVLGVLFLGAGFLSSTYIGFDLWFHHYCVCCIMSVERAVQWAKNNSYLCFVHFGIQSSSSHQYKQPHSTVTFAGLTLTEIAGFQDLILLNHHVGIMFGHRSTVCEMTDVGIPL